MNKLGKKCRQCVKFKEGLCSFYNKKAEEVSIKCEFDKRKLCRLCNWFDTSTSLCSKVSMNKFKDGNTLRICTDFKYKGKK